MNEKSLYPWGECGQRTEFTPTDSDGLSLMKELLRERSTRLREQAKAAEKSRNCNNGRPWAAGTRGEIACLNPVESEVCQEAVYMEGQNYS